MEILHRDDLERGGFAELREHQLVIDSRVFGEDKSRKAWNGIGNFVYLSDARFLPKGETKLHSHKEIDVISVMVEGRIIHEGSLEHGQELQSHHVQAQRAGGEGFSHNEINPDDAENSRTVLILRNHSVSRQERISRYRTSDDRQGKVQIPAMENTMNTIPKTDSIQELAEFWDTHDITDFFDELEEVSEPVFIRDTVMEIHLSSDEAETVRKIAKFQGIGVTDLIHNWIVEQAHLIQQKRKIV